MSPTTLSYYFKIGEAEVKRKNKEGIRESELHEGLPVGRRTKGTRVSYVSTKEFSLPFLLR